MTQALGPNAIKTYRPLLEIETHALLRRLAADPTDFTKSFRRYAGSLTLLVVYGHRVTSSSDETLVLAENCVNILANEIASGGGLWPVDIFPALKHLPEWMPGAGFKRKAAVWKAKMLEFVNKPYDQLVQRVNEGTAVPCFCSTIIEDQKEKEGTKAFNADQETAARWAANSMYAASIDTTIAALQHFVLAMIQNPDVLAKAQQELDTVVGAGRMPTFSDRAQLPYVEAVMNEVLRWAVPVPLGLPHRLMEDDIYNGKLVPKGSLIFANIWNMLRDENIYPDAHSFNPDRFMVQVDEVAERRRDPRIAVFGFGRRRCPGMHLVESSLWIVMASMMASFDFSKAKNDLGNAVDPKIIYNNSIFRTLNPYNCDIRPRSEQSLKVIRQTADSA